MLTCGQHRAKSAFPVSVLWYSGVPKPKKKKLLTEVV